MSFCRTAAYCALILFFSSAAILQAAWNEAFTLYHFSGGGKGGVHIGSKKDNKVTKLWGDNSKPVYHALFSPDGKKIGFVHNNKFYLMNNDGSDVQTHTPDNFERDEWGTKDSYTHYWTYTTNGIIWQNDIISGTDTTSALYRYEIEKKKSSKISDIKGRCRQQIFASRDGRRIFIVQPSAGVDLDTSTGNKMCLVNETFTAAEFFVLAPMEKGPIYPYMTTKGEGPWGHGNIISLDGKHVVTNKWGPPDVITPAWGNDCPKPSTHGIYRVYDVDANKELVEFCVHNGQATLNWDSPDYVVNENDWLVYGLEKDGAKSHIINWKLRSEGKTSERVSIPRPSGGKVSCAWLGPLPSPHDNTPFISIDLISISINSSNASSGETDTATNIGRGTMSALTTKLQPTSASWLTVTKGGSGNTQTFKNTVDIGSLSEGEHTATVTVSGGGAANTQTYKVYVTVGQSTIARPTGLASEVTGDNLNEVVIKWKDNASDEEGYAVERKQGSDWKEVGRASANATSYTETGVVPGIHLYRVRAYKGSSFSAYSDEHEVTVVGVQYIKVLAPTAGEHVMPGEAYTVKWEANQVDEVVIEYSVDEGVSWTKINADASVKASTGSYTWNVGSDKVDNVSLRIYQYGNQDVVGNSGKFRITDEPNSVKGELYYSSRLGDCYSAQLYDIRGRKIRSAHSLKNPHAGTGLSAGIYCIAAENVKGRAHKAHMLIGR